MTDIEFRWYKSVDDPDYRLQFRRRQPVFVTFGDVWSDWQDIPFVLEGV